MNVLGLFSGIGGFELGFQRAGFRIAAMCENEPYARAVLAKHWPGAPLYDDVRRLSGVQVLGDVGPIDVITGGFPCQDISLAGKGAGLAGERSGLWREYARLIGEIRPAWVVAENVSALRSRGLGEVLGSLAALGYDAEWHCIPASAVGAPHRRDRIWIVAYARGEQLRLQPGRRGGARGAGAPLAAADGEEWHVADAERRRLQGGRVGLAASEASFAAAVSDAGGARQIPNPDSEPQGRLAIAWRQCGEWVIEPDVGRVANGVPSRVHRLRALGNAVVPQIPEILARAIHRWDFFNG